MSALPQQELEAIVKADGGEVVCASGFCCVCDYRFKNELVARYADPSLPGGWAFVELRHLCGCLVGAE